MEKHSFNQIFSSITACLILFQMGVWTGYLSVMIPRFKAGETPISLSVDNISWMIALVDMGLIITSFPVGYLMDRFGRLASLRLGFISFIAAISLILAATAAYHLYLASILVGLAMAIANSTPNLYVAEIAKPKIRGSLSSVGGVLLLGGTAVTMTLGPYLSFGCLTWAILLCPLAGLILTFFAVESPYYHFIRKDRDRAAEALSRVRNNNKPNKKNAELESIRKRVDDNLNGSSNFLELISQKSSRKAAMIVLILGSARTAGGFVCITLYALATLPSDSHWDPKISMMIFSWLNVTVSLLGVCIIDRYGRKPLLIISLLGLCLVTAVLAVFYYFYQETNIDVSQFVFVPHVGVLLFCVLFQVGIGPVTQIHRGELLSVNIKGPVSAIATIQSSVIFFIYNKTYFAVERSIGVYFMYVIFSVVNFIGMIFTITCVFETKGKTLEEIQNLL